MDERKISEQRDAGGRGAQQGEVAEAESADEWGMLMEAGSSRLDLASDMLPAGLSDRPSMKSFGG